MSELQMAEIGAHEETITTEVLVEEGNVRVEIEGMEVTETHEQPLTTPEVNIQPISAETGNIDLVEFPMPSSTKLAPTGFVLSPPTTMAVPTAPTTAPHLTGEVSRAYKLETELQRSRG